MMAQKQCFILAAALAVGAVTAHAAEPSPKPEKTALEACALLGSDEIESVQGEPVQETKASRDARTDAISQCYFLLPTASQSISLTVIQKGSASEARNPKDFWKETFHGEKRTEREREEGEGSPAPEKIEGLGDEAFWIANRVGGKLLVLKGNRYFKISVGGAKNQEERIEKSKRLARMVLKRF